MSQFIPKKVEYNGAERVILVGSAKLVAPLSNKELTYTNAQNQTKAYRLATIEITSPTGAKTEMLASVAQRNIELMAEGNSEFAVGASYLTSIDRVEDRNNPGKFIMLARLSHLRGVEVNAVAMAEFDAMFADVADVDAPEVKLAGVETEEVVE